MNLKKPKFWDQKKPNIYAYLLQPIAILVKILNIIKRKSNKQKMGIKTICVGNIYLGGTGKTSLCIRINEILNEKKIKSCFIKKLYKNQTDEQKLLQKNGVLFLSSKRVNAVKKAQNENYEVAIFDDGIQDKSIQYDLSFVCFNNLNWIGNGMTIPAGPLREDLKELKNYNNVFLNGNLENIETLKNQIYKINPDLNLFIGKYILTNFNEFNKDDRYLVFSGIGNHNTFLSMLKNYNFNVVKDIEFADHYLYSKNDIDKILKIAEILNCKIITTEKDFLRIKHEKINKIKSVKSKLEIIDEDNFIKKILEI